MGWLRVQLDKGHARAMVAVTPVEPVSLHERQRILVERVAFVIPRVAARLPWRANCLVQALAAERWLRREGIATTLTLGIPKDKPAKFEAHAWLTAGTGS